MLTKKQYAQKMKSERLLKYYWKIHRIVPDLDFFKIIEIRDLMESTANQSYYAGYEQALKEWGHGMPRHGIRSFIIRLMLKRT